MSAATTLHVSVAHFNHTHSPGSKSSDRVPNLSPSYSALFALLPPMATARYYVLKLAPSDMIAESMADTCVALHQKLYLDNLPFLHACNVPSRVAVRTCTPHNKLHKSVFRPTDLFFHAAVVRSVDPITT